MRFASLGSGSRGNALLIETGTCRLLLDCGFSVRELEQRLAQIGVDPQAIDALLITHEHGDHIRGAAPFARRYRCHAWMTHGTWLAGGSEAIDHLHLFHAEQGSFRIGDADITPFTIPHDAREPCQYRIQTGSLTLAVLTDAGTATPHLMHHLREADALVLECNHDETMLANGPYPPRLRARVGGNQGHLSNRQAADILSRLDAPRLQHLAAAHLSEKNNHPDKAKGALLDAVPEMKDRMSLLSQDRAGEWVEVV